MNQNNSKVRNRLELYLKNMDLLKINPSVGVNIIKLHIKEMSAAQSFLKLLNDWSIRECYFSDMLEKLDPIIEYLRSRTADSSLKSTRLYIKFSPHKLQFIYSQRDHIERTLKAKVFSTKNYIKRQKAWGRDIFYIFDGQPEIYPIPAGRKTINLLISHPEDVIALYQTTPQNLAECNALKWTDIFQELDQKNGLIKISGPRNEDLSVLVLRKCQVHYEQGIQYDINFLDPENVTNLQTDHQKELIDHFASHLSTFYELDSMLPEFRSKNFFDLLTAESPPIRLSNNQTLLGLLVHYFCPLNKENSLITPNLKYFYLEHINSSLLNRLSSKRTVSFILPIDHPVYADLVEMHPIAPKIDLEHFIPDSPYAIRTIIHLKKFANSCFKNGISQVPIHIDHLLNLNHSFTEKKFNIDYLFLKGANHVNFSFSSLEDMKEEFNITEIKKWDPNFPAYFDWFAYVHQLGHFFKLGIRRPEIMVLYPSYDEDLNLFDETIKELESTGLDYTIIDFETFCNNSLTSIQEGEIILHNHNYRLILLPAIKRIPIEGMQKLNKYHAHGGVLIALGRMPSQSKDDKKIALLKRIKKQIWLDETDTASTLFKQHESGGLGYFQQDIHRLKNILEDLQRLLRIQIESEIPGIVTQVREINENYFIFVLNTNLKKKINFRLCSKYLGRPYGWDFARAESEPCPNWYVQGNRLLMNLSLDTKESRLLILDKKQSLKTYQITLSELDGSTILQQDSHSLHLVGWQRKEGNFQLNIQKGDLKKSLSYNVLKKLPILVIDPKGWYIDSDHFKGKVSLGDQSYPFPFKSTTLTYTKLIILRGEYLEKKKLFLDLGKLFDWCILNINEQYVEKRLFEPWIFDITEFMKEGDNKISIQVTNNLSNLLAENSDSEGRQFTVQEYGLLGPVRIIPYSYFKFKI